MRWENHENIFPVYRQFSANPKDFKTISTVMSLELATLSNRHLRIDQFEDFKKSICRRHLIQDERRWIKNQPNSKIWVSEWIKPLDWGDYPWKSANFVEKWDEKIMKTSFQSIDNFSSKSTASSMISTDISSESSALSIYRLRITDIWVFNKSILRWKRLIQNRRFLTI